MIHDDLPGNSNLGFSYEEEDSLRPPSSRASSRMTRDMPLPGYVEEAEERCDSLPPPSYVACTIPPPVYDELYPVTENIRAPKTPETNSFRKKWLKLIFCVGYAALATTLLIVGIKHTISKTCEDKIFLLIWCLSTGVSIDVALVFALSKRLRQRFTKFKTISPIIFYTIGVFSISWFIGGIVSSWDQLGESNCDQEVVRAIFASCIIGFASAAVYCCALV